MANIRATQSGNFSSSSTWVGGNVPTAGDNVYSNTHTVTIDTNITCTKISNIAEHSATAGGKFVVSSNVTINANVQVGATVCLEVTNDSSPTINGNVTGGTAALGRAVDNLGTGTLSVSGTVTGGNISLTTTNNTNIQHAEAIRNSSSGTISLTGNVNGGLAAYCSGIVNVLNGNIIVNGNVFGSNTSTNGYTIRQSNILSSYGLITVNGNVYGSTGTAISFATSSQGDLTINGNCYGASNNGIGVALSLNSVAGEVNIYGNVEGGSGSATSQIGIALAGGSDVSVNIVGNCTGGRSTYLTANLTTKHAVNLTGSNSVNIIGDVAGGPSSSTNNWTVATTTYGLSITGPAIVNVTGNIDVKDAPSNMAISLNNSSAILNFTGNIYDTHPNNNGTGITNITNTAGILNITGNVYGKNQNFVSPTAESNYSISQTSVNSTTTVVGNVYGGLTGCGIRASSGNVYIKRVIGNEYGNTLVAGAQRDGVAALTVGTNARFIVEEVELGSQGNFPVLGQLFLNKTISNPKIIFRDPDNYNTTRTLTDPISSNTYPLSSDVRYGISYAGGNLIGSCNVPSPSNVSFNIPVGTGIGNAVLTASDFFNFNISGANSNSIWARLNNCATVESTVAQIAAAFSDN
jgi:hypothetical protein